MQTGGEWPELGLFESRRAGRVRPNSDAEVTNLNFRKRPLVQGDIFRSLFRCSTISIQMCEWKKVTVSDYERPLPAICTMVNLLLSRPVREDFHGSRQTKNFAKFE